MYRDYEDELQLMIDKVEGAVDETWEEVVDELGINVHPDSLRKSFTGGRYGGYQVAKYYQDKFTNEYCAQEEIEKLESLKNEVYKEKVKLQDQRRELRKHLSNEARFENLLDVIREEADRFGPIKLYKNLEYSNSEVNAALCLGDIHYGSTSDNVLNLYNIEVCKERLNQLLNKTIYYCGIHRVKTLYLNLLGDNVSGLIHQGIRCEQEEDVISQTLDMSEILVEFIAELSKHVAEVVVVGVQGNHSRCMSNLKESLNPENFERIIFEWIKKRLPEVKVLTNGLEDWCAYNIGKRKIFIEHGDKSQVKSLKEKAINLLGYVPTDIFCGHYHHMEVINDGDTDIIINGSVMGVDSFAMNHRLTNKPHQVLRVYFNDDDVCTYKLMLD